jgi:MFS family permease
MNNRHVPLSLLLRLGKRSFLLLIISSIVAGFLVAFIVTSAIPDTDYEDDFYNALSLIFLLALPLALIFFILSFIPALKKYKLLKQGRFKKGYIVLMLPASDMNGEGKHLTIHYYYNGSTGKKLYGEDNTPDMDMLTKYKKDDEIKIAVSDTDETKSCIVSPSDIKRYGWTD